MANTVSERFKAAFSHSKQIDRLPVMEWALWWDKTLEGWSEQGLPLDLPRQERYQRLGLDDNIQFWLEHYTQDAPKPQGHGSPLIETPEDYANFKRYILPKNSVSSCRAELEQAALRQQQGTAAVWYTVNGFFWFPRELFGIENHLYAFYDCPELYHTICEDLLHWQIEQIQQINQIVTPEFMTIAEDMSYNLGPMLSEEMFDEFILPYYKKLIPAIQKTGTKVFIDTDGKVDQLVPWILKAGADGVAPLERQAGVDVAALRQQYPSLLMFGGFDKMCLFKGKEAIRQEFERLLPTMKTGGFIPAMDHQTPPGVSLETYHFYVSLLAEYAQKAVSST